MKILITGCNGFIAKNLVSHLKEKENIHLYLFSKNDSNTILDAYLEDADFIFHLAGVNRPEDKKEFYEGNSNLTKYIVNNLEKKEKNTPIILSSSIQAELDNDYGKSKLQAEKHLLEYSKNTGANVNIYRLPNVFGKWCKPNYNSVIATWCFNINNNIPLQVNDENYLLNLVYIDDVISSFLDNLEKEQTASYYEIPIIYKKTLGEIKNLLEKFKANRETLLIPEVGTGFERALYATYLSYTPHNLFSYELKGYTDERGTFYEILKTKNSGQFSLSTTAPGVTRGNHYHHTKNEKFLVVKGKALLEYKHIITNEVISYKVSDKKMEVIEMIPGYTHNIKNIGNEEMILFLWANEKFDPINPDTYFLKV